MLSGLGEMETEFEGLGEFESEFEGEGEFEFEGEFEAEGEFEGEGELEFETQFEGPNPVSRVYPDAMMEHMGLAAMEAETESEAAEHFLPLIPMVASKLLPLAAKAASGVARKMLPRVAKAVTRATPTLTRGVTALTKKLHVNPQTRHLVRAIPSAARRAVTAVAKHAAKGHPVPPRHAAKILAHETRRVLGNPRIRHAVLRRAAATDRKMHHVHGKQFPHRYYGHGVRRLHGPGHYKGHMHGGHPTHGGHRVHSGHPVYGTRGAYGQVVAGRAGTCPTCGSGARPGVRRVCCCC